MSKLQGSLMNSRGDPHLGEFVDAQVPPSIKLFLNYTPPVEPVVLKGIPEEMEAQPFIDKWIDEIGYEFDDHVNSRSVIDDNLRTKALTHLFSKDEPDWIEEDVDEILAMFIGRCITEPNQPYKVEKMTEEGLIEQPVKKANAGSINLDPFYGRVEGDKETMVTAAAKAAIGDVGALNARGSPKPEVIKVGKKVRMVLVDPMPVYLKNSYFFGKLIRRHGPLVNGDSHGLSKVEGNFNKILFSMYLDQLAFTPQMEWEEFLDKLEEEGLDEDDKEAWEATVGRNSAIACAMHDLTQVVIHPSDSEHLAQVLAHDLCPIVKYHGNACYVVKYRVISGGLKTLYWNGKRHRCGPQRVAQMIQEHGMIFPQKDCVCKYCAAVTEDTYRFTMEELSRITGGVVLGDDRLRRAFKAAMVAQCVDEALGTVTVAATMPAFGGDGQKGAEFLKTQFRRRGNDITTFRDEQRVFCKLVHGNARNCLSNFVQAITSATLELGDNMEANTLLHMLYDKFDAPPVEADKETDLSEGLLPGDTITPFTYDEVMLKQFGMEQPWLSIMVSHTKWNNTLN